MVFTAYQSLSWGYFLNSQFFKALILSSVALSSLVTHARAINEEIDLMAIRKIEVREVTGEKLLMDYDSNHSILSVDDELGLGDTTTEAKKPDVIEKTGKVIQVAKDLVALGEDVYKLVTKGRPNLTTNYAPISVIPRGEDGKALDVLSDMEGWSEPIKSTFEVTYTNYYNAEVVKFRFSVMFSYGGSYNNKGAYITSAQIVPEYVRVLFGYDFSAVFKLAGVYPVTDAKFKNGKVAGATLIMEHTVKTLVNATSMSTPIFISGTGVIKAL